MQQAVTLRTLIDRRAALVAAAAATLAALLIGIPTAVIPNGFFTRMTPTRPLDYLFLAVTVLLVGLIAATYAVPSSRLALPAAGGEGRVTAGGLLTFLAVGCPVCNKLVVLALGFSGALNYFAPLQPFLGLVSVALLAYTAWTRLRTLRDGCAVCAVPATSPAAERPAP